MSQNEESAGRPGPTLREIASQVWADMEAKGFHAGRGAGRDDTLLRLCLVHTEVSEAAQVVKRHWGESPPEWARGQVADELADVVIRVADLAGCLGLDLEQAVLEKMAANRNRPRMYGTPWEGKSGPVASPQPPPGPHPCKGGDSA